MFLFYFLPALGILIKTISYGMFEIQEKKNKVGGAMVISIALFGFVFSNILFLFFGKF